MLCFRVLYKNINLKNELLLITSTKGIWVVFGLPEIQRPEHRKQNESLHYSDFMKKVKFLAC